MPGEGQNIIEVGFNVEKLSSEQKQVFSIVQELFAKLKEYDGTQFNPLGTGGLAELKKSLTDGATAMASFQQLAAKYNATVTEQYEKQSAAKKSTDELTLATAAYKKIVDDTARTGARNNALSSDAAEGLALEREALKQRNTELANAARYQLAESGSVAEARAAVAQLTIERDKLGEAEGVNKERIQELNTAIDQNNAFIQRNVSALEQQKINIGNYTGAVVVLESSLASIAERLTTMTEAGETASEAYQKLVLEQKLLQAQLDKQQEGFSTVTAELRSMKSALDALAIAGLENTEAFQNLNEVYTTAKQRVAELHAEQKILTSENPALTALTAAARGLGGAYALGAGASALFADGNEKVEKELNKLVAIMTLLQGLEEAVKAIKERGAIATVLQATATKALVAARELEIKIFGSSATVLATDTAAKETNTEAATLNTAGLEANAEGAVVNAAAVEGVTIANEAATAATIGFRTALISTGIGAIVIGLIYGITKLVGAISDWAQADERAVEKQKALAESSKELYSLTSEYYELLEAGDKEQLESLEKKDAASKAAGKNQFIQLQNERDVIQQRLKISSVLKTSNEEQAKQLGLLNAQTLAANEKVRESQNQIDALRKASDTNENEDDIKKLEKKRDAAKSEYDEVKSKYSKLEGLYKDFNNDNAKLDENSIAQARAAFDLLQKINADAAERRFATSKEANDRVLNDDKSSFAEKLTAFSNNYGAEARLEKTQQDAVEAQAARGIITQQEAGNQVANLQNELLLKRQKYFEDLHKLSVEYNDRELQARNTISKTGNESDASIQEAITKDVQKELTARLDALKQSVADKAQIIADDYTLQVKLAKEHGKTETEIAAITADKNKDLVALTAGTQKEIYEIVTSYGDRKLKAIQEQNKAQGSAAVVTENYNKQTADLDAALVARTISYEHYIEQKKKLDNAYSIAKDKADIDDDEAAIRRIKNLEEIQYAADQRRAESALALAKLHGDDEEIKNAQSAVDAISAIKTKAAAEDKAATEKLNSDEAKLNKDKIALIQAAEQTLSGKVKQLQENSFTFATSLVNDYYENRVNKIQADIDQQDKATDAQVAAIQRSTLSQQDQAAEVIILQAEQKARDTELKNEQKAAKIQEAKFDRDVAVAKVVWDTERAIVKDIADNPFPLNLGIAAADAALGAVSIATILAKPIPTYAEGIGIPGKGIHPGGPAIAGEAGPELVTMPGREPFILDKPTLLDMPARTTVMPISPEDIIMELSHTMMVRGAELIINMPNRNDGVVEAIDRQTERLARVYKQSQRKIINIVKVPMDNFGLDADYMNTKIFGRKP